MSARKTPNERRVARPRPEPNRATIRNDASMRKPLNASTLYCFINASSYSSRSVSVPVDVRNPASARRPRDGSYPRAIVDSPRCNTPHVMHLSTRLRGRRWTTPSAFGSHAEPGTARKSRLTACALGGVGEGVVRARGAVEGSDVPVRCRAAQSSAPGKLRCRLFAPKSRVEGSQQFMDPSGWLYMPSTWTRMV